MGSYKEIEDLISIGSVEIAKRQLVDWLKDHPADAQAWLLYGKCLSDNNQKKDCFRRALIIDPSNEEAKQLLDQIPEISLNTYQNVGSSKKESLGNGKIKNSPIKDSNKFIKSNNISEINKRRFGFILYSFFHILITILLGVGLYFVISTAVPGVLEIKKTDE